jgi:hypothetical protein
MITKTYVLLFLATLELPDAATLPPLRFSAVDVDDALALLLPLLVLCACFFPIDTPSAKDSRSISLSTLCNSQTEDIIQKHP